jgi:lysophospholipase L1-like esterase
MGQSFFMKNPKLGLSSSESMSRLLDFFGVKIAIYFLLVSYLSWEIYWFSKVGLTFIRWHTHLAFPIYLFGLLYLIFKKLNLGEKYRNSIIYLFITVFLFEAVVLLTGIGMTYSEKKFGHFVMHPKNGTASSYYWIDKPNYLKKLTTNEFSFTRKTNSIGYSDKEWRKTKSEGMLRAVALGDSFTEGDGAHEDSNYVSHLRREITKKHISMEVFNAGKCGSDPYFNFMNYRNRIYAYQPDLILQTISTQDLTSDILNRGGMERFMSGYRLRFQTIHQIPKFIYGISYFSRPFFHLFGISHDLEKSNISDQDKTKISKDLTFLMKEYHRISEKNNCKLILIFFPLKEEVSTGYDPFTKEIMDKMKERYLTLDLRNFYLKQKTKNRYHEYYWNEDGHHNAKGYKMMAQGILEGLLKQTNLQVK